MKEWTLDLDRPRRLRYDFKAIRRLRERYVGKEMGDLMEVAVDELPFFAWAGLVWEDPTLTPEAVENLLDEAIGKTLTVAGAAETIAGAMVAHIGMEPGKKATSSVEQPVGSDLQPEISKT